MTTEQVKQLMTEGLISMSRAAKMFGSCRSGAGTHAATLTRKCLKGDRLPNGNYLKLEHVRVANRIMTSEAAVIRHIAALTEASSPDASPPQAIPRSPSKRARDAARVDKQLDQILA